MSNETNGNDKDSLLGAFNTLETFIKKTIEKGLPVKVTKVSSDRKFVNVKPLIMIVSGAGETVERDEIKGIPIQTTGAGGFMVTFNVSVNDLGWIESSDRDISLFKQGYKIAKPNTKRMHSFSDGRFVPDIMNDFVIDAEDGAAMTIQNRDASVKISLSNDVIKMKQVDTTFELSGGAITGVAPAGFDLNGFTIAANGAAESPVSLTSPSAIIGGKEMADHDHPAGSPPGNTGTNN